MSRHNGLVVSRLNLFDPSMPVEVEFELERSASVSLFLFDGEGRERETIISEKHYEEGTHRVELPVMDFRKEPLFYRLIVQTGSDRVNDTKKITVAASSSTGHPL